MDHRVCVIWVQRPRRNGCVLVCMFSITSARTCVWLTRFPRGPSGNRREWPPQTPPRHPPFPVGRKKMQETRLPKIFMRFPLYSTLQCIVTATWRQRPVRPNTPLRSLQWHPKALSEQNHTNTCKHTHTLTHTHTHTKTKTDKESKFLTAPFLSLDRNPVGMFTLWSYQGLYGSAHIPWRFCGHVSVWLEAQPGASSWTFISSLERAGDECVWPGLPSSTRPGCEKNGAAVTTWSISGALCLWVACIFNIAEG